MNGFDDGAEVFFNNKGEGNEWTRHTTSKVAWDKDIEVVSGPRLRGAGQGTDNGRA